MMPQGRAVHLQYFMPQLHQPEPATDLQNSAVRSSPTSPPATMWEHHQQAALQSSSSSFSFPSWSPYAGTTAALLGTGSTFTADSSPSPDMRLPVAGEHVHGHAWGGQHGEQSNNTCYRENFLDLLASKNVTPEMFEEVPDDGHYAAQAPSGQFGAASDASPVKYEMAAGSPLFAGSTTGMHQGINMMSCMPRYAAYDDHLQMKDGSNQQQQEEELEAPAMASFLQQLNTNATVGLHGSMDYSGMVFDKICQESRGMEPSSFSMRSLPDFSSFGGYKSTSGSTTAAQPYMRRADLSQSSKQEQDIVPARSSSTGSGAASDCKKRLSEERTSKAKKSKPEGSKSPAKQLVPKVKIGEKITALQQIVSPFGKTDTASVLFETIKYIKFMHEQVQILSESPYTDSSRNKGNFVPWGDHEKASKAGGEHDLRDRGLCLVPVSWTPRDYRDGTAMDYWTPAYRGCLYR